MTSARGVAEPQGLTAEQVTERVARGEVNHAPQAVSRSLGSIIRANTFTWFNGLIGLFWIVMLAIAPIQDSLFGFVIVANTAIGIIQEYRASRTLARLSVIGEVRPRVRRDGATTSVRPADVVLDDVIVLAPGDQLVVDGEVLHSVGLELDESLLTGEADPVAKAQGDTVMSGSFVVAGEGYFRATRVGRECFVAGLTEQARAFAQTNSELRNSVNAFIRVISLLLIPIGAFLLFSQLVRADLPVTQALRGSIAGMVTMVPEGLVLLTSIAMAVAVVRLAGRRVLVQDLPAVEVLARVDTVCVDKTGTLTEPGMQVREVIDIDDIDGADGQVPAVLAALGSAQETPNPTLAAIARAYPPGAAGPAESLTRSSAIGASVPFSSARKWSAADIDGLGTWVLGAPEMLLADGHPVRARAQQQAADGSRVLLLARAASACGTPGGPDAQAGAGRVAPTALVVIDQRLRADAAQTVTYFGEQGVRVIVISGDNAATVGSIAHQAGVPGANSPVDARDIPAGGLIAALAESSVFGRVTPAQKQEMVGALHAGQHTVAMTGDGVNDVLALKTADLGIAMGSGSDATRAVAQLVLLDDQWSVMPDVVAEGRRVLGNIERVSDVFLTKSCYAMIIALATAMFAVAFPFLPRHLSLISALTIGIPAFFLALMPNTERFRPGFLRRVLLFAIPAGVIAAASAFTSYGMALAVGEPMANAQSAATVTLFIVTVAVLWQSARPINPLRAGIVLLMVLIFALVLLVPWLSEFFALSLGPERYTGVCLVVGAIGGVLIFAATAITDRWRRA